MTLELVTQAVLERDAPKWREFEERLHASILNGGVPTTEEIYAKVFGAGDLPVQELPAPPLDERGFGI